MVNGIRTIYLMNLIKGSVRSFQWVPEFNMKHIKKAEGRIGRNIVIKHSDPKK